ncbi:hypothetical protein OG709_35745 (plasmid) [Streptomyces sp. NBC_01267]|uniref:hypothetical protein n=1 Tax=Streptomyces sp. NBC_01267 TaxID=2903805 RepID=UPI002E2F5071|nr:hypothetical protein [Streptomyces sp. NBC_01267]
MIGTELTKQDNSPEHVFTGAGSYTGPVLADITCPDGTVHVTVDPAATVARVQVRTDDPTGPVAKAVKNTRIHQTAERLTIVVPPIPPTTQQFNHGGVFVSGNSYSTMQINGVTFSGQGTTVIGSTGVEVLVTLPARSGVKYISENGSIHTYGVLAALKAEATNGSVKAETVGRIEAEADNGSVKLYGVRNRSDLDVRASAGNGTVKEF